MIWKNCTLKRAITETDALDNVIQTGNYETIAETQARFTPWTLEEEQLLGLSVTKNTQKYALPVPFDTAKTATHAEVDGVTLTVKEKKSLAPRWTLVTVEAFRV